MPTRYQKALRERATLHLSDAGSVDLVVDASATAQPSSEFGRSPAKAAPLFFASLLEKDLVDQLNLTIAPDLFGGATRRR